MEAKAILKHTRVSPQKTRLLADQVRSKQIAEALRKAGYTSVQDVYAASEEELCNIEGMGQKTAERLKEAAKYF